MSVTFVVVVNVFSARKFGGECLKPNSNLFPPFIVDLKWKTPNRRALKTVQILRNLGKLDTVNTMFF